MSLQWDLLEDRRRARERERRWRQSRMRLLELAVLGAAWFAACVIIALTYYGFFFL